MSDYQLGRNPSNLPMRPLNGGIVLNRPSQILEGAQCVDAQNYIITENGPKRRPGYEPYGAVEETYDLLASTEYRHIDLFAFWTSEVGSLEHELMLITAGPLFKVGIGGMEEVEWSYDTGTIDVSGETITGTGTAFLSADLSEGFILRCGGGEGRIEEIISETGIRLREGHTIPDGAGLSYSIQHAFNDNPVYLCDWVVHNNEVIFTDFNSPPVVYKPTEAAGSQLDWYIDDTGYMIDSGSGPEEFVARCVAVFQERVFMAHTLESTDGLRRQRIRWSTATNPRDFSDETAYIDLPYTQGGIVRMVVLGNTLVVYFDDTIFIGLPTNNPNLPVAFQKVDTGNIGLVGMKAIASYVNGHFFVGQDDMYIMTVEGPQRIGASVVARTIRESQHKERIYATIDPSNDRAVFGFTKERTQMEELWSFNYKSRAWSYTAFETYMLAYPLVVFSLTWDDLIGFTWSETNPIGGTYPTWETMSARDGVPRMFAEYNGYLRQLSNNGRVDKFPDGVGGIAEEPIEAVYETGDLDLDTPDQVKTFLRISAKIDFSVEPDSTVNFSVQGSWNRGRNWKRLGTLRIRPNWDEGYVNFLMTSSHVRFRLTTTAEIAPFTITEMVVKVRVKGMEKSIGAQQP